MTNRSNAGLTASLLLREPGFELVRHLLEKVSDGAKVRSEDAQGVVTLGAEKQYSHLLLTRSSQLAISIWHDGSTLLHDSSLHIGIRLETSSDKSRVDAADDEKCNGWCERINDWKEKHET